MPDTFTTNLNLTKPEVGASRDSWGVKWNSNADALDTAIGNRALRATEIGTTGGLEGGGSLAANRVLSISDGGVSTAKIANGAVTNAKLAGGSVPALLGYTPVNKAGDTMTGGLYAQGGLEGLTGGGGYGVRVVGRSGDNNAIIQFTNNARDAQLATLSSSGGQIYCDTNFVAAGNVAAYSDQSIKTNVRTVDSALEKVKAMRGVYYDRVDDAHPRVGVIAQEMETVLPEVIYQTGEGLLAVAYGDIVAVLIEAIKEQNDTVAKQGRALEDLTARVKALEAK